MSKNATNGISAERQSLLGDQRSSYSDRGNHQRPFSRLEWAESAWFRYPSILFWWWIYPIISLGYKQTLTENDLDDLPQNDQCSVSFHKLHQSNWKQLPLIKIIFRVFGKQIVLSGLPLIPYIIVRLAQPCFIRQIVSYINHHQEVSSVSSASFSHGYLYAVAFFICIILQTVIHQQYFFHTTRIGLKIKNLLTAMIYTQLLSLNLASSKGVTTSQAINLVAHDAAKFDNAISYIHFLWNAPVEMLFTFGLVCWFIGIIPTLCGYSIFMVMIPLQIGIESKT